MARIWGGGCPGPMEVPQGRIWGGLGGFVGPPEEDLGDPDTHQR